MTASAVSNELRSRGLPGSIGNGSDGEDSNNMAELAELNVGRTGLEHTTILRCEDDGGQVIEYRRPADRSKSEAATGDPPPTTLPAKAEFASGSL
jgi:hypothetical protein